MLIISSLEPSRVHSIPVYSLVHLWTSTVNNYRHNIGNIHYTHYTEIHTLHYAVLSLVYYGQTHKQTHTITDDEVRKEMEVFAHKMLV